MSLYRPKRCTDCGELKTLSEYPRNRRRPDGHSDRCRACLFAAIDERHNGFQGVYFSDRKNRWVAVYKTGAVAQHVPLEARDKDARAEALAEARHDQRAKEMAW